MRGIFQFMVHGRVGKDVALDPTRSGDNSRASINVGVNVPYMKNDKWEQSTTWVTLEAWGKMAELAAKRCRKGDIITATGTVRSFRSGDRDILSFHVGTISLVPYEKRQQTPQQPTTTRKDERKKTEQRVWSNPALPEADVPIDLPQEPAPKPEAKSDKPALPEGETEWLTPDEDFL